LLSGSGTVSVVWNVRFDHLAPAEGLQKLGFVANIVSLEQFKSFWGAIVEFNRVYVWRHPVWKALGAARRTLGRYLLAGRNSDSVLTESKAGQ
jgi:hypothetical protein